MSFTQGRAGTEGGWGQQSCRGAQHRPLAGQAPVRNPGLELRWRGLRAPDMLILSMGVGVPGSSVGLWPSASSS